MFNPLARALRSVRNVKLNKSFDGLGLSATLDSITHIDEDLFLVRLCGHGNVLELQADDKDGKKPCFMMRVDYEDEWHCVTQKAALEAIADHITCVMDTDQRLSSS